jgi:hypothetical protein
MSMLVFWVVTPYELTKKISTFQRNILIPSSALKLVHSSKTLASTYKSTQRLKLEAAGSSETLVSTYKFTRRYNPEEQHRLLHSRENLKFQTKLSPQVFQTETSIIPILFGYCPLSEVYSYTHRGRANSRNVIYIYIKSTSDNEQCPK